MTGRYKKVLPAVNAINPGGTSIIRVPLGPTYWAFMLSMTKTTGSTPVTSALTQAEMATYIREIRLMLNGRSYRNMLAGDIIALDNKYRGLPMQDGILPIILSDTKWWEIPAQDNLSWGTNDPRLNTFEIQIDIDASASGINLAITGEAVQDDNFKPIGYICEKHTYYYSPTGAGEYQISDLPRGNGAVMATHFANTNTIGKFIVKANQVAIDDGLISTYNQMLVRDGGRVPQSGFVHHDFCYMNRLSDCFGFSGISDFRYNWFMTGADNLRVIMETLNSPVI